MCKQLTLLAVWCFLAIGLAWPEAALAQVKAWQPGDRVAVGAETPLMAGARQVGKLMPGMVFTVEQVQDPWVAVSTMQQGQRVRGWVQPKQLRAAPPVYVFSDSIHGLAGDITHKPEPWTDAEKQAIRKLFAQVEQSAGALVQRASAYRPIELFRASEIATVTPMGSHNGLYIPDKLVADDAAADAAVHELIHGVASLVDVGVQVASSDAWYELVQPLIDEAHRLVVEQGGQYFEPLASDEQRAAEAEQFAPLVRQLGLPNLEACQGLESALRESVAAVANQAEVSPAIQRLVEEKFFTVPYVPDNQLRLCHQIMEASMTLKYAEVIKLAGELTAADPDFGFGWFYSGMARLNLKDEPGMLADIQRALPTFGRLESGFLAHSLQGVKRDPKTELDLMLADFTAAVRLMPRSHVGYEYRAFIWYDKKEFDKAIDDLSVAIALRPGQANLRLRRAEIFRFKKSDYAAAEADYSAMIDMPNVSPDQQRKAYEGRAGVRAELGKLAEAWADFEQAITMTEEAPAKYKLYLARARLRDLHQQGAEADADYALAIELLPDETQAYGQRAVARKNRGDLSGAIADLTLLLEKKPNEVNALIGRAECHRELGDYTQALADYEAAKKAFPSPFPIRDVVLGRGMTLIAMGQFDEGLAEFDRIKGLSERGLARPWADVARCSLALRDNPDDVDALAGRGWVRATTVDSTLRAGAEALADGQRAVDLSQGKHPRALEALAAAHAELGDFEKAAQEQARAIEVAGADFDLEAAKERLETYQQGKPYRIDEDTPR